MRARSPSGAPLGLVPSTRTSPASAARSPVQISIVVVLPAPLGPSNASTEAAGSSKSSPSTAVTGPNRFTRPRTLTAAALTGSMLATDGRVPGQGVDVDAGGALDAAALPEDQHREHHERRDERERQLEGAEVEIGTGGRHDHGEHGRGGEQRAPVARQRAGGGGRDQPQPPVPGAPRGPEHHAPTEPRRHAGD